MSRPHCSKCGGVNPEWSRREWDPPFCSCKPDPSPARPIRVVDEDAQVVAMQSDRAELSRMLGSEGKMLMDWLNTRPDPQGFHLRALAAWMLNTSAALSNIPPRAKEAERRILERLLPDAWTPAMRETWNTSRDGYDAVTRLIRAAVYGECPPPTLDRFVIVAYDGGEKHCLTVPQSEHAEAIQRLLLRGYHLEKWASHDSSCRVVGRAVKLADPLCTCGLTDALTDKGGSYEES